MHFYARLFTFLSIMLLGLFSFYYFMNESWQSMSFIFSARSFEEWQRMALQLSQWLDEHTWTFILYYATVYIILQSFAIPGTLAMNMMAGYLLPFWLALLLTSMCAAVGASNCYLISWLLFSPSPSLSPPLPSSPGSSVPPSTSIYSIRYWQSKLSSLESKSDVFFYLLFLRVTPFVPNWALNVSAPHFKMIPLDVFFMGTWIGVMPLTLLHLKAGRAFYYYSTHRHSMDASFQESFFHLWTTENIIFIILAASLSLLPILLKKRMGQEKVRAGRDAQKIE